MLPALWRWALEGSLSTDISNVQALDETMCAMKAELVSRHTVLSVLGLFINDVTRGLPDLFIQPDLVILPS